MVGANSEKPMGKAEQKKVSQIVKQPKQKITRAPIKNMDDKKSANEKIKSETPSKEKNLPKKKIEQKKESAISKKVKKEISKIDVKDVGISTKYAVSICKFIVKKPIDKAIKDLEKVSNLKQAVPMKGEIPHRKGKIMSGRFPVRASKKFILLLKSLAGNAIQNDMDEPIISEAIANKGTTVYGKLGRVHKKKTNIKIICIEKKLIKKKKK